ncbi:DUF3857 domain-containing protein [Altibacter sp.]|uniref:DUF3857 domain-containing protein n=1 Tax=Altibacter sp. TaxID=2024823 RepID=UPI002583ECDB|nr:DUF3857 domain-containing protein [Altibacter sp.]MCW9036703.1 DUF3857 domain-containing protein [Altibacter sp.]
MKKLFLFVLLATGFSICAQSNYAISSIPSELLLGANSVLLQHKIQVDVSKEAQMEVRVDRVVTVLNKMGDAYVRAVAYYDDDVKVRKIEAYVYDASGKEMEHYRKNDFNDVSASDGFSLYTDDRVLYMDYTPTRYPYTVAFSYEKVSNTTAFLPRWYPLEGTATSTLESSYTITYNPVNTARYKAVNLEGYDIAISEEPSKIICRAQNLKARKFEEHSPPFLNTAPQVLFALDRFYLKGVAGYGKDWNEFGRWMERSLLGDVNDLPEATIAQVRSLVSTEKTPLDKARKVYEFVQNKVRYISVQIGVGGWKPMLASEVDKLSYGDCKALTNYTKALLDAVGVPSYYTVLYSGPNGRDFDEDFSAMQGDHVILGIPSDDDIVWLECTSQDMPFGFGGTHSDDRDVLVITPEGGKIVHTKKYAFDESLQHNTASVQLDPDGGLKAQFQRRSMGLQYDQKYYLEKFDALKLDQYYKEHWDYINGFTIDSIALQNNKEDIVFLEGLKLTVPKYCSFIGEDLLLAPNLFNQSQFIPPRITDRKQPLFLPIGFKDVDQIEIELPEGFILEEIPEGYAEENKFGLYSSQIERISARKIRYTRTLIIKKGTFTKNDYSDYRNFRRNVSKWDKSKILLKRA